MTEKMKVKGSSEVVQVTGKSGDYYRVYVKGVSGYYHDWYHKDQLTPA
jgi:hypothetical protein